MSQLQQRQIPLQPLGNSEEEPVPINSTHQNQLYQRISLHEPMTQRKKEQILNPVSTDSYNITSPVNIVTQQLPHSLNSNVSSTNGSRKDSLNSPDKKTEDEESLTDYEGVNAQEGGLLFNDGESDNEGGGLLPPQQVVRGRNNNNDGSQSRRSRSGSRKKTGGDNKCALFFKNLYFVHLKKFIKVQVLLPLLIQGFVWWMMATTMVAVQHQFAYGIFHMKWLDDRIREQGTMVRKSKNEGDVTKIRSRNYAPIVDEPLDTKGYRARVAMEVLPDLGFLLMPDVTTDHISDEERELYYQEAITQQKMKNVKYSSEKNVEKATERKRNKDKCPDCENNRKKEKLTRATCFGGLPHPDDFVAIWMALIFALMVFLYEKGHKVFMRVTLISSLVYHIRNWSILSTILPTPLPMCEQWLDDLPKNESFMLEGIKILAGQRPATCTDVLFSGHTIIFTLGFFLVWTYLDELLLGYSFSKLKLAFSGKPRDDVDAELEEFEKSDMQLLTVFGGSESSSTPFGATSSRGQKPSYTIKRRVLKPSSKLKGLILTLKCFIFLPLYLWSLLSMLYTRFHYSVDIVLGGVITASIFTIYHMIIAQSLVFAEMRAKKKSKAKMFTYCKGGLLYRIIFWFEQGDPERALIL